MGEKKEEEEPYKKRSRDLIYLGTDLHEEMSKYDLRQPTSSFNLRRKGREAKGGKRMAPPLGPLTNLCREILTKDQLIFDCVSGELQVVQSKQKEYYQVLRQAERRDSFYLRQKGRHGRGRKDLETMRMFGTGQKFIKNMVADLILDTKEVQVATREIFFAISGDK